MIGDTSLVMRVYNQCRKVAAFDELIIATDDERIVDHVKREGGKAIMTSRHHRSGTERCAEIANSFEGLDYVVNIQGDEPFIQPEQILDLIGLFDGETEIATLYKEIGSEQELFDPGIPKVALGDGNRVLYFSRSTVPHLRNVEQSNWLNTAKFFKHIGIYGYRMDVLATISQLPPSIVEEMEQLEQLRWIANGKTINAIETVHDSISVDTEADLELAREFLKKSA